MSLQNVQAEFAEFLFSEIEGVEGITPHENLIIYKNNVKTALLRALEDSYPLIVKLVGADFFRLTAKEYIKRYPSRSSNLQDYGQYFSDFLIHYQPLKELVYLAEVAQFEWLCHSISFATDPVTFDPSLLATLHPEQYQKLIFTLNPASQLIKFYFPILDILDLCKGKIDKEIDIRKGGVNLLIMRKDFELSLVSLPLNDFTFLAALQVGKTLSQALTETEKIDPHFQLDEKLTLWIKNKIIVNYILSE